MEFYVRDPARAPAKLRRALTDNAEAVAAQRRAIAAQQEEQRRIHARFDAEALRLQTLWLTVPRGRCAQALIRPNHPLALVQTASAAIINIAFVKHPGGPAAARWPAVGWPCRGWLSSPGRPGR